MAVYLVCLDRKYKHARHYLGATADLRERMQRHREGRGSALLRAAARAGIGFRVTRQWPGSFTKERRLKAKYKSHDLCPRCSGRAALRRGK